MKKHERKRHAASQAVMDLRNAMGMTQQAFAHEIVKGSIVTVGRWETSRPPTGAALIKLAEIAYQNYVGKRAANVQPFLDLERTFRELYFDEVVTTLGLKDRETPFGIHVILNGWKYAMTKERTK